MNHSYPKLLLIVLTALLALVASHLQAAPNGEPIVVESALPNEAEQGQELDVTIRGQGFGKDAKVKYLVTNTDDDSQITVLSTTFIDETALKTRIRVSDTALVTDYDIVVQRGRRKGKGTTRFSVLPLQTPNDGIVEIHAQGAVELLETCVNNVNDSNTTIGCNGNDGNPVAITLGEFFLDHSNYEKGGADALCFAGGPTFIGTVQLGNDFGSEDDRATFRFPALNIDGTAEATYVLTISDPHLGGWSDPPGFPPPVGQTTTLIGTHWSLGFYRSQKKYKPCAGSGELSGADIVTVDLSRLY